MQLKHLRPCSVCPFRRQSCAGWLGAAAPEEFIQATLADADMPCHATVDYEDPNWRKKLRTNAVAFCAGAIVFLRNACKLSRNPERAGPESDRMSVFTNRAEFLAHHEREEYDGDEDEGQGEVTVDIDEDV